MSLKTEIRRLHRVRDRLADESRRFDSDAYAWYDRSCPCGKPPGECPEHPRAREAQRPPEGDWRTWFVMAGRGFGKTRTGAEWVRSRVETGQSRRVCLLAPTAADVRDVMVEGESGLMAVCPPWNRPIYEPSKRRLTWPNGAVAICYSADEPERLRGPQFDSAWCDEVGAYRKPAAFDNLRLGLRLGTAPRAVVTTTPRATTLIKSLLGAASTVKTGGSTLENRANLAPEFVDEILARYEGSRLGRQEIYAELLEVLEGAWFTNFDPKRNVSEAAEWVPGLPVRLAVDCGVSRHTGAVFIQVRELGPYRHLVTVFGDYYAADLYSEANALAIRDAAARFCRGAVDRVLLDPASTAKTGVGPAAFGEYEAVFGSRATSFWPMHSVADGLDQIELLVGTEARQAELLIHPRCTHLIAAFNGYVRHEERGEFTSRPKDPNHPHEDLMDALRGGIRDALPEGRKPRPALARAPARQVF